LKVEAWSISSITPSRQNVRAFLEYRYHSSLFHLN
jgi:hypothetical protein